MVSSENPISEPTRAEIFAQVLTSGPLSRTGLAERLGLSPSTVTRLLPALLDGGYLAESEIVVSGPGRPQTMLEVNADRHLVVGIKIAPNGISGVLTDLAAQVLARADHPLTESTADHTLTVAAELIESLLARRPADRERVLGVGVGVSGHVDTTSGVCRYSALLDWYQVDLATPLSAATGLRVVVNNDVNTLVVAERWFGEGREVNSFAVVTIGVGIGCGLLLNGGLYAGASGLAGELGHLPLDPAGPMCGCGQRGCLESLASDKAVLRHVRDAGIADSPTIEQAIAWARERPGSRGAVARSAFAEAGAALGRSLAGLCNLLNLQKIIIAGEGAVAHDLFGTAMTETFERHAFSEAARDCTVRVHPVHNDLWARGAACLVIRESIGARLS